MKYFTPEWWTKAESSTQVAEAYWAYLSTVREQLPTTLLEFVDDHTLHDSTISKIDEDSEKQTLLILFDGWNQRFDQQVQYTLKFYGVSYFVSVRCDWRRHSGWLPIPRGELVEAVDFVVSDVGEDPS